MTRPSPLMGSYLGLETAEKALNLQAGGAAPVDATRGASLLRHLNAASRAFEQDTRRYFFPYVTTNYYRWPQLQLATSWTLWTEEDLLAVTQLQAMATGVNDVPVALTHYFLEPQWAGPPYSRIEVDLSSTDVYQSGTTPQRSIAVTGLWGYWSATTAAGTVTGLSSGAPTTCTLSSLALVDTGDVLLIDAEAIYVLAGGTATPTLLRGVNGTTVTTHADNTAIAKYIAPADVADCVLQQAVTSYLKEQRAYVPLAWGSQQGNDPNVGAVPTVGMGKRATDAVIDRYARARSAAI